MIAQKIIVPSRRIYFLLFFIFPLIAGNLLADDLLPENPASKNSRVIMRAPLAGDSDRPSAYDLKKWIVEESSDPVKHALEVYKKKSEPQYTRRIWATGRADGKKRLLVEYISGTENDKVIFSPDEDFMYYLGLAPGGQNIVYGINLLSNKKFSLGAGNNFQSVNCPDKQSYIVVQSGGQGAIYQVYSVAGQRMKTLTNLQSPMDIEKELCR